MNNSPNILSARLAALYAAAVSVFLTPVYYYTANNGGARITGLAWCVLIAYAAYYIFRTGKTALWRSVIFITLAAGALVNLKLLGGGFLFSGLAGYNPERIPCHIAESANLLFVLRSNITAFVNGHGTLWLGLSGGMLFLLITLALGRAWCGWACIYGGIDETFSKLLPRKWRMLQGRIPAKTRYFSVIVLAASLLAGAILLTPAFCVWLCPLKLSWSFLKLQTAAGITAAALMAVTGVIFLVLLPMLSGKRIFCAAVCPFGAWQSFAGRINPYRLKINKSCIQCGKCAAICPVLAIDRLKDGRYHISPFCVHCGRCAQACPCQAVETTVMGVTDIAVIYGHHITARRLFTLTALIMAGIAGLAIFP